MDFIIPIILIISSLGVFFGYVDPNYRGTPNPNSTDYSTYSTTALQAEFAKYQSIAQSSNTIVAQRNDLIAKENTISTDDQARLEKLLPSNIDNIRLIIEISQIAQNRNLVAKNISVSDTGIDSSSNGSIGANSASYGTLSLKFTVNASYNNFINLLQDLENNLRLVDITNISFTSTDNGFYDFNVTLNTYWLK
jgi:Tfp pilus assembly protein PilO